MNAGDFGKYLSELRKEKGLSIYKLSKLSNVSHSYISQIERGLKGVPSPEILIKLSKPLGIHYARLLKAAGHISDGALIVDGELLVSEEEYEQAQKEIKSRLEREEVFEELSELYYWWMKLVTDKDGFLPEEIAEDFFELFQKYDLGDHPLYISDYLFWEHVPSDDIELCKKILQEVIEICKKHTKFDISPNRGTIDTNESSEIELVHVLTIDKKITFNGHTLDENEKHLALGVLKAIFQKT